MQTRSGSIGVQLTIPIFTGGMRSAKHDEAVALADKARRDADAARQGVAQRIRAAYLAVRSGLAQSKALEQGVLSAESKLDATRIGRDVGARTTADVLNAQQAYFGIRSALTRARYQILISALELDAAGGVLDESRLARVNAFLAP
jgi:outer membrane protein